MGLILDTSVLIADERGKFDMPGLLRQWDRAQSRKGRREKKKRVPLCALGVLCARDFVPSLIPLPIIPLPFSPPFPNR
jgi:hypothetical protein